MKFYLTVNPHGGTKSGPEILKKIKPLFDNSNIELNIIETMFKGHAKELAEQLGIRKRQVNRYKTMLKNNVVSQNKYDNELILLSKNRSDYIRAKTMLERAKEDLSDTVLKSHFNGRLFNVKINQGQFLNSNENILFIFKSLINLDLTTRFSNLGITLNF